MPCETASAPGLIAHSDSNRSPHPASPRQCGAWGKMSTIARSFGSIEIDKLVQVQCHQTELIESLFGGHVVLCFQGFNQLQTPFDHFRFRFAIQCQSECEDHLLFDIVWGLVTKSFCKFHRLDV